MNGRLVLNKTRQRFKRFLDVFNSYPTVTEVIPFDNRKPTPGLNDYWFAGFFDAEGSVYGTTARGHPRLVAELDQKDEPEVISRMAELLGASLNLSRVACRLSIGSYKGKDILIEYLDAYPLHSNKLIAYIRFRELHLYQLNKDFKWSRQSESIKKRISQFIGKYK